MTTLYIVRHCEAHGNTHGTFQGHIDADVSEKGIKQLERLSERFKKVRLDAVYSSPLLRAQRTADAVNRYMGLPVIIDDELIEIDGGHWENKPLADLPRLFPDEAREWNLYPHNFEPEGGESMKKLFHRISTAVMRIVRGNEGKTIAVVSHACAIRNLMCYLKGMPIENLIEVQWTGNTAVTKVEFDRNFTPKMVYESDISHLSDL